MSMIDKPGIYPEISDKAYFADPCPSPSLSCSIIDELLDGSPRHAKEKHPRLTPPTAPEEWKFNMGSVVHAMLLGGAAIEVLSWDSYRKGEAQAARDATLAAGKTPVLTGQYDEASAICDAIREQVDRHPLLQGVLDPDAGSSEVTVAWEEPGGIWCRCRPDRLLPRRIIDWKITGTRATEEAWGESHAFKMGYHRRALFYRRGLRETIGVMPQYHFAVVENEPPYELNVFECTNHALDIATKEIEIALQIWTRCMMLNDWPGYTKDLKWIDPGKGAEYRSAAVVARHQMSMPREEQEPFVMRPEEFGV